MKVLCPTLFDPPWTVAYRAPPSMGFYRQEYWSGLPFPYPTIWKVGNNKDLVYSTVSYIQYLVITYHGKESEKEYIYSFYIPACQCRRHKRCGFNPQVGKIPRGGHGGPLQYSCLENPMDRGAWRATVHREFSLWNRYSPHIIYTIYMYIYNWIILLYTWN